MSVFSLHSKVFLGPRALEELGALDLGNLCIVCDPYMEQSGVAAKLEAQLAPRFTACQIFSKVVPDPTVEVVIAGVKLLAKFRPDTVIALGGGSAIDTGKAMSYLYSKVTGCKKPHCVAIPTTSGTGSEVTSFAVISDPEHHIKYALSDEELLPDMAALLPELTLSVPAPVTADTGFDVLTHALEAYVSPKATDFSDALAEKAVELVFSYLPRAVQNGGDAAARERLHSASCMAGMAFQNSSLGLCHGMAHPLGAQFHLSHGRANALLLPHIVCWNAQTAGAKYAAMAKRLGGYGTQETVAVHFLVRKITELSCSVAIPSTLKACGISEADYRQNEDALVLAALGDRCTPGNPTPATPEEVRKLYRSIL
ncbi:MAG: 1-propanol dehydrogenase PduQ [Oscillospiraceae bacterium]